MFSFLCIVKQKKKKFGAIRNFLKIFIFENLLHKKGLKGGFQLMLILGLLVMYFDAAVVFVTKSSLLFRLALAILWLINVSKKIYLSVILYIWREDLFTLNQLRKYTNFRGLTIRFLHSLEDEEYDYQTSEPKKGRGTYNINTSVTSVVEFWGQGSNGTRFLLTNPIYFFFIWFSNLSRSNC